MKKLTSARIGITAVLLLLVSQIAVARTVYLGPARLPTLCEKSEWIVVARCTRREREGSEHVVTLEVEEQLKGKTQLESLQLRLSPRRDLLYEFVADGTPVLLFVRDLRQSVPDIALGARGCVRLKGPEEETAKGVAAYLAALKQADQEARTESLRKVVLEQLSLAPEGSYMKAEAAEILLSQIAAERPWALSRDERRVIQRLVQQSSSHKHAVPLCLVLDAIGDPNVALACVHTLLNTDALTADKFLSVACSGQPIQTPVRPFAATWPQERTPLR